MRYRGIRDRQVSLTLATLLIAGTAGAMAFAILRTISSIDFAALAAASL
ncbi:MAG TPA: hypothetical protein VFY28_00295 [Candidatus Paceibacterota bacterium]|nr:hypothetical protein [Candidatus Paceibacterota bacterium]